MRKNNIKILNRTFTKLEEKMTMFVNCATQKKRPPSIYFSNAEKIKYSVSLLEDGYGRNGSLCTINNSTIILYIPDEKTIVNTLLALVGEKVDF